VIQLLLGIDTVLVILHCGYVNITDMWLWAG